MSLTPTEREEHFFKAMVDAAYGSTPEELEPTERKEHWYKEIIDAIKSGGGGSGGGDVEIVKCAAGSPNTCDHTYAQLKTAIESGKRLYCEVSKNDAKYCGWLSWQENQYVGTFWMYVREAGSQQQTKVAIGKDDSITITTS